MNAIAEDPLDAQEFSSILEIPLEALLEYCDPTLDNPWGCGKIDPVDVIDRIEFGDPISRMPDYDDQLFRSYEYNVGRIAHFLQAGWADVEVDSEPVTVDIGLLGYTPPYLIVDGNHRVAAAKLRGDSSIAVEIIGDVVKAEAVFLRGVHPDDDFRLDSSTA